ncbi:Serine/threonine-protein kinase D [Legionella beliardensis]|uniref:Serine/threonine-protein kinase D n=1 Tax=Legionella beliardensis TaxID=91822 RepID=A0A378I766_9GAMM|nr:protein kinase [Legionella beliardensis]STX28274.1 Serine/threonine-protein kinase D [Legionella beliardensis]
MKLHELRQLLIEYDETTYLRKYLLGNHERAQKFRQYLEEYKNKPGNYELIASDIFTLLNKVPEITAANSNLQLIQSIRSKLQDNYFFEIYTAFHNKGLINKTNFELIYGLSQKGRLVLYNLFCSISIEQIYLNSEGLEKVLLLLSHPFFSYYQAAEDCLRFLHNRNYLTSVALDLLLNKKEDLPELLKILKALDDNRILNDICLKYLNLPGLPYYISDLISLLNQANMDITQELFQAICRSNIRYILIPILAILIAAENYELKIEKIIMLLQRDFSFLYDKLSLLQLLHENHMLDNNTFDFVFNNNVFYFEKILEILTRRFLVKTNQELLNKFINKELDCCQIYPAISYLNDANLLDQKSFNECIKLILLTPTYDPFGLNVFSLFKLFENANFYITREKLDTLFSLSNTNICRLYRVTLNLITHQLLNQDSFEKAFQRVTAKLPSVSESEVIKKSRKQTGLLRSEIILDNKNHFFTDHDKQYEKGGFGKVKKGFNSLTSDEAFCGIKKLKEPLPDNAQKEAIREVKYNHLLGRPAFYYSRKGATSVLTQWQRDKGLHLYSRDNELLQIPLGNRLRCLSAALAELNILHRNHRVHGDIKCQNLVLNLKKLSLKLIDFGSAHKVGSAKMFARTRAYKDPYFSGDHFSKDLYAMGLVVMYLFPEVYTITFDKDKTSASLVNKPNFTVPERAIINLVNSMMHSNINVRCTSEDALDYCNKLLANFNKLNLFMLETITNSSLHYDKLTVEQALRV